ncbi:hypothetical protein BD769DRAFT_1660159 [Suillus cothurnatus]|nr:hypothetical protein BD769DRAFT_1660159 [Suillus cothurnatus]
MQRLSHFGSQDALTRTQCHCSTRELHRCPPTPIPPFNTSDLGTAFDGFPLVFEDQYLRVCIRHSTEAANMAYSYQVASPLPYGTNIYGLGEMRAAGIPLEVQWNDIDVHHAYRDFTTDPVSFPGELRAFIRELAVNNQHCNWACTFSLPNLMELVRYPHCGCVERGSQHVAASRAMTVLRIARLLAITFGTTEFTHFVLCMGPYTIL